MARSRKPASPWPRWVRRTSRPPPPRQHWPAPSRRRKRSSKAILKIGVKTQGQGHETTFAQIVANELGIPPEDVYVQHGDTDNTPYSLGTYASRSTPTAGAATAVISRKLRDKARKIAAHLLEADPADLEWDADRFQVKGVPGKVVTIQDIAFAAYTNPPKDEEPGLEGVHYYDPPNMTYPFGSYVVVVEVDEETGEWKVRRMVAVDDCGVRINPMIVEGQIHGGLTEGFGIAAMQLIDFDEYGNCLGSTFMDYLLPTSWETPRTDGRRPESSSGGAWWGDVLLLLRRLS